MKIEITNVHLDLGAGRRGTDMGPSAIHVAGLVPRLRACGHDLALVEPIEVYNQEGIEDPGDPNARFLEAITRTCGRLADRVEAGARNGWTPLVLGGDHAQAIGTISGLSRVYREREQRVGVIWVDAHTDMNTPETSPTGNIHGMPLAALLGHGRPELVGLAGDQPALRPEDVAIIGARDVDAGEVGLVKELGVRVYTMSELDQRGTAVCLSEAIQRVTAHTAGIHLSFDLDGVDPQHAPGVGTPVPGGLTVRESHLICETVHRHAKLLGMEMVELNPTLDHRNKTGELAVWLILSAFGKTIL
ncbi:MAG: arginase [Alphaproteobacteria bacterium]|nr:arginase [Alphaproteobacteria bacterium]